MIGKQILHYRIIEKLGEGGMGIVYKARDTKLNRDVAIKFLPGHIAADLQEKERFRTEAQAAAALNHANVTHIYAIEQSEQELFIVMELIEGRELSEVLKTGNRFGKGPERKNSGMPVEEVISYVRQIAAGLQAAHSKEIVHRDIKSSNIMVTGDGGIKIMDFGLAKLGRHSNLTKAGTTLGTIAYMSPEQARSEEVDHRCDIWSLGVVMYEMLTAELPFKGEYEAVTIYNILNEQPQSVRMLRPDIPEGISDLISGMLEKDATRRIQSAGQVIERIDALQTKPQKSEEEKSIAVLNFENMSPDKDNEYFCTGITEDIITDLSKIGELKVIPRSDVLAFQARDVNSRKVGEILNVAWILEGSVRKAGQQIRVSVQLVNVKSGYQIWAERYDRLLEDIFDVQTELSQKIATALKVSLSDSEKERLAQKPTDDLRAHDFYMRGREFLNNRGLKNNESAMKMFDLALEIDPHYAMAYVALVEAYAFQYMFYGGDQKWLGMMITASDKARELDPNLVEQEATKGMVYYYQKRFNDARRILEKYIEKRPGDYQGYFWLGNIAETTDDMHGAIKYYTRAAEIKPYSEEPALHLEMNYRRMGQNEKANAASRKVLELVEQKLSVNAGDPITLSRAAAAYAIRKDEKSALAALAKLTEIAPNDGLVLYNSACTYAQLGRKDEALDMLKKAFDSGYKNIADWVAHDPDFEPFWKDPDFNEILQRTDN